MPVGFETGMNPDAQTTRPTCLSHIFVDHKLGGGRGHLAVYTITLG